MEGKPRPSYADVQDKNVNETRAGKAKQATQIKQPKSVQPADSFGVIGGYEEQVQVVRDTLAAIQESFNGEPAMIPFVAAQHNGK